MRLIFVYDTVRCEGPFQWLIVKNTLFVCLSGAVSVIFCLFSALNMNTTQSTGITSTGSSRTPTLGTLSAGAAMKPQQGADRLRQGSACTL